MTHLLALVLHMEFKHSISFIILTISTLSTSIKRLHIYFPFCKRNNTLSREALLTLIRSLLVSKLDYCNSVLVGMTKTLQRRLQSVFNAAA